MAPHLVKHGEEFSLSWPCIPNVSQMYPKFQHGASRPAILNIRLCPPYAYHGAHQKCNEAHGQLHAERLDATGIGGEKDFSELPSEGQDAMLNLLQKADPNHFDWWMETLVGKTPDSAEGLQDRISR